MTCFTRPITALRQMVYAACWPPMLILCHKPFVNLTVGTVVTIVHAACASHSAKRDSCVLSIAHAVTAFGRVRTVRPIKEAPLSTYGLFGRVRVHTGVSVLQIYTPLPCCAGKIKGFYQTTPANNCGAIGKPQILYMYNQNMSPASQPYTSVF